ncbi:hypothetical protein GCM10010232_02620 [Streptomyces amakusaensis]|uniref:Secreted protein n=1 Tax=Streptomyces amakusaensis TaxID=67271 RepID=A0ABW0ANM5_9ACTN
MRRRLLSLAVLGSALTMGFAGTASAAAPATAAVPAIRYVSPQGCIDGGGKITFHYIFLGCSGGTYDGYRIGG